MPTIPFCNSGDIKSIPTREIVLILDADTATVGQTTRDFLAKNTKKGNVVAPRKSLNKVNSVIVTNAYGRDKIYSSPYAPNRLKERLEMIP